MERSSAESEKQAAENTGRAWLNLSDAQLLEQCKVDTYRASGPGGQKRNKTSSAVRLRHQPTGLTVIAEESRSQHENKVRAIRRLRQTIALSLRNHLEGTDCPPAFYLRALADAPGLHLSLRHPEYWPVVQYILDVFFARRAAVAETAEMLQISTGQLIRFLKDDPKLWEQANHLRREFGRQPLR